jgi:hypothetical protein
MTIPFVDEKGNVIHEEPRFQPVSGEEKESIPPLETLPCPILKENGWERLPAAKAPATRH